jgi:pyridoxine kinase
MQVVTSLRVGNEDVITVLGSTVLPQSGSPAKFRIRLPQMDAAFTGTGDLMAALLLAHSAQQPAQLAKAVETAVATLQAVLQATMAVAGEAAKVSTRDGQKSASGARSRELRLIQGQAAILHPEVVYRAEAL